MAELTRRYVVMTMATEAPFDPSDPEGVFVLKPWKDPAALRALAAYRENCYPELGRDLEAWIRVIEAGPIVRGDVGKRNEAHVKGNGARASRPAARSASGSAQRRGRARAAKRAPVKRGAATGRRPGKRKKRSR
jgi:hypothetical protein